jgi:regulator of replication initiation timing
MSVIGDKMSNLEISLGVLENKLTTLDSRVDNIVREKVRASIETRPRRDRRMLDAADESGYVNDGSVILINGSNPSSRDAYTYSPGLPPHAS